MSCVSTMCVIFTTLHTCDPWHSVDEPQVLNKYTTSFLQCTFIKMHNIFDFLHFNIPAFSQCPKNVLSSTYRCIVNTLSIIITLKLDSSVVSHSSVNPNGQGSNSASVEVRLVSNQLKVLMLGQTLSTTANSPKYHNLWIMQPWFLMFTWDRKSVV